MPEFLNVSTRASSAGGGKAAIRRMEYLTRTCYVLGIEPGRSASPEPSLERFSENSWK